MNRYFRFSALLLACLTLTACGGVGKVDLPSEEEVRPVPIVIPEIKIPEPELTPEEQKAKEIMSGMTLEEKVGQLFLVRCPTGEEERARPYHVGGYLLFAQDFEKRKPAQMARVTAEYQAAAKIPMIIAVDEEGGTVTRISRFKQYRAVPFKSPRALYKEGDFCLVQSDAIEKARLLKSLGVNVNMGPVCDVCYDKSAFMYQRSFGICAELTARYVSTVVEAMAGEGVGTVLKHYPGYGDLKGDGNVPVSRDDRALETFDYDEEPFRTGLDAGSRCVLVSHTVIPAMGDELPASLSPAVHERLRSKLGFDGVIMTDDLYLDAIRNEYDAGEAAVMAILAGNDMICCTEFETQIPAVISAVRDGRVSEEMIDEALMRVLLWKIELNLITL